MKITVDTNILMRAIVEDVPRQGRIAERLREDATLVAMPPAVLCELCWVLARADRFGPPEISRVIPALTGAAIVAAESRVVEAGLAIPDAGGDFAGSIIAHSGQWLGGDIFVSFDQKAVALLKVQGMKLILPQ